MRHTILITEDNEIMQLFLEAYLGERFRVVSKNDGEDALKWMERGNRPDLILADIEMPNMDGFQMLSAIRSNSFYSKIPFIMLSGKEKSEDRIKSLKLGANDYITKPFNPEELELKIEQNIPTRERS